MSTAKVFVSRGRTVVTDPVVWTGEKWTMNGPGTALELPRDVADQLRKLGFVQDTEPTLNAPPGGNPGAIGYNLNARFQGPREYGQR